MTIDPAGLGAAKRIAAMKLGSPTNWKDADTVAHALLAAEAENPSDCGNDHPHPCGDGSGGPACRKHLVLWNLEKEMRAEELEAELVAVRQSYEVTAANLTATVNELGALKAAAEEFLNWQNGVPLDKYDPPFTEPGRGYTASLNRLEELLKEKSA